MEKFLKISKEANLYLIRRIDNGKKCIINDIETVLDDVYVYVEGEEVPFEDSSIEGCCVRVLKIMHPEFFI